MGWRHTPAMGKQDVQCTSSRAHRHHALKGEMGRRGCRTWFRRLDGAARKSTVSEPSKRGTPSRFANWQWKDMGRCMGAIM